MVEDKSGTWCVEQLDLQMRQVATLQFFSGRPDVGSSDLHLVRRILDQVPEMQFHRGDRTFRAAQNDNETFPVRRPVPLPGSPSIRVQTVEQSVWIRNRCSRERSSF